MIYSIGACSAVPQLKALIIDGQNNHVIWPKSTAMMAHYLEETGLFEVDVYRTQYTWRGKDWLDKYPVVGFEDVRDLPDPKSDPEFKPNFGAYDLVVSNFGWQTADWPSETQEAFEDYVSGGGGLVVVHAADNAFPEWEAYNRMIGLGGWGERDEKSGPYLYYDDAGTLVRDTAPGRGGSHGPQHVFQVMIREKDHPITRGMPELWMHTKDELYDRLRGPAENVTILATAYSSPDQRGTGRHEPTLMTIDYEEGRVFHTTLGHTDYSLESVGFIVSFQRGAEWAATGDVTQAEMPADFPTAAASSSRKFNE